MKTKQQTRPAPLKHRYAKPEIKKRERLKEITESPAPAVTGPVS